MSGQSAWVVADVLKKCFELAFVRENSVVVAMGEEGLSHVWLFTGHDVCIVELRAIYFGAAYFKALHNFAKMARHLTAHEE